MVTKYYLFINPQKYRLSKTIRDNEGTFIYNGLCCTRYEPGKHMLGDLREKLEVTRLFHKDPAKKFLITLGLSFIT
ncbi:MAG: hypothetical protein K0Q49_1903 [Haloplasmataceae bacterium]|jgi:hypothetical protein|nr:hypothetical protein [Haloplasmataceae bacterium]